ncbi:MAG TPA: type II toxin-antitoxin system PemK/MazF family toxin [Verrucomicrobiae bacterium]
MKPWEIYTWSFPDAGSHPAVILGTEARLANKPKVNVLFCSSQRATRQPELHEVLLDESDGLDWKTICKCDLVFAVPIEQLSARRGSVSVQRRRLIAERIIRALGLAGL